MSHRIIVAEDHPLLRHGLKALLGMHADYQVVDEAVDGREAVTKTLRLQPDLVLMDLQFGASANSGGADATRRIRELDPDCPTVLMTAYGSVDTAVEAMRRGATDYIEKPFKPEQVLLVVARVAGMRRTLAALTPADNGRYLQHDGSPLPW